MLLENYFPVRLFILVGIQVGIVSMLLGRDGFSQRAGQPVAAGNWFHVKHAPYGKAE
ncbi:hypothetical protein [Janthinobacterium sp. HLX7-2]|uniref:hypothetical protein n=1 Tax=Janthinobacterium sp. HLX7-2 TaxID=1259331 RepID=UPI003F27F61F